VIIVLAGLPEPECNYNVFAEDGTFLARGDLAYSEYKLLLEYQGDQHRTDRAQWRSDIRRTGRLEDAGWQVLQFTDDDLRDPAALVARIRLRLRARGARL
jgi:very-short-patch-repair endonuclease